MPRAAPGSLISINASAGFAHSRLLLVWGPLFVAGALVAAFALVAASFGWYRAEMLLAAAAIGAAVAVPTFLLVYRSLSRRMGTDVELHNVQARVLGIIDSAMDAIVSVDEAQRIVLFNAAAERTFGYRRDEVIGKPLDMLMPERFRASHRHHIENFGRTATTSRGMGAQTVLHGVRASGEEFPIEASISQHSEDGHKVFTVILRDVTQRVRAERMLARSEARLRAILDSAMDAIITVDEKQNVVLFNRAAEAVFGVSREEAMGTSLPRFIPERFRAGHGDHIRRFGETGVSSRRMGGLRIVTGVRRDGQEFPIDASISQTAEGRQRFYTVILRDVTERVRNEEALRRSREEIRHLALAASTAREQEKSRIARELHDELGQALTALKIDVGWLKEKAGDDSPQMAQKLSTMHAMIDSTVAATRRISADLRPLMLDDLGLTAATEWLVENFTTRTGIACGLVLGEGDLELRDPYATAVFRVLQESLTNVARHAQASRVDVKLARNGSEVRLDVQDDGRGFAVDDPRKPNSFGLLGQRERATLLGGEVAIDSTPGKGTMVHLRLPLDDWQAGEPS